MEDLSETVWRYAYATKIFRRMAAECIDLAEGYHAEKQAGVSDM